MLVPVPITTISHGLNSPGLNGPECPDKTAPSEVDRSPSDTGLSFLSELQMGGGAVRDEVTRLAESAEYPKPSASASRRKYAEPPSIEMNGYREMNGYGQLQYRSTGKSMPFTMHSVTIHRRGPFLDESSSGAASIPMSDQFRSLLVSGRDRVRFLHNFCTADIRGLSSGQATEAFFTDARGRIFAHGYVLVLQDHLQVWLLADDPQRLLKHLDRYIISDDVTLRAPADGDSFAVTAGELRTLPGLSSVAPGCCGPVVDGQGQAAALCVAWSGQTIAVFCGDAHLISTLRHAPDLQPRLLSDATFSQLRITEGFPIIGVDLAIDHLAPEANRNAQAICYTKGCYLGQEPIARIDALGHVNRALKIVRLAGLATVAGETGGNHEAAAAAAAAAAIGAELLLADEANETVAATLTSAAVTKDGAYGLAVLRLSSLGQITRARLKDGRILPVAATDI